MTIIESFGQTAATMGLKKVIKIVAVIVGLFLAGLAYLQYNQISIINWNKLQTISEGTITTLSNAITQIPYACIPKDAACNLSLSGDSILLAIFHVLRIASNPIRHF
jgi:uncharacterized membrane protein (Fun14 family)